MPIFYRCLYIYIYIFFIYKKYKKESRSSITVVEKKRHNDTAASNASACTQQRFACSENVCVADSGTKLIGG